MPTAARWETPPPTYYSKNPPEYFYSSATTTVSEIRDQQHRLRTFDVLLSQGRVPRGFYDSFDQGWSRNGSLDPPTMLHDACFKDSTFIFKYSLFILRRWNIILVPKILAFRSSIVETSIVESIISSRCIENSKLDSWSVPEIVRTRFDSSFDSNRSRNTCCEIVLKLFLEKEKRRQALK